MAATVQYDPLAKKDPMEVMSSAQLIWDTGSEYPSHGIANKAVTISGFVYTFPVNTFEAMRDMDEDTVRSRFASAYLDGLADFDVTDETDNRLYIMDIEGTAEPKAIGENYAVGSDDQNSLIDGYILRAQIMREQLPPNARIGIFGVIATAGNPDPTAVSFTDMMAGFEAASDRGMFDQIDVICPILYHRFGIDDIGLPDRWDNYVDVNLEYSHRIHRRDGSKPVIAPFVSPFIFNGSSNNNLDLVHENQTRYGNLMRRFSDRIRQHGHRKNIGHIIMWHSKASDTDISMIARGTTTDAWLTAWQPNTQLLGEPK